MTTQKVEDLAVEAAKYFDALKTITAYMSPDQLRRVSEKKYGLDGEEAIEMAYENVLQTAKDAIKGMRRPRAAKSPIRIPEIGKARHD